MPREMRGAGSAGKQLCCNIFCARWAMRWKPALNAFAITFNGRITPTGN
jgi:hypothetical protein